MGWGMCWGEVSRIVGARDVSREKAMGYAALTHPCAYYCFPSAFYIDVAKMFF